MPASSQKSSACPAPRYLQSSGALVESYSLNLYPTLLIVGPNGTELDRVVGGKEIRNNLKGILIALRANSK